MAHLSAGPLAPHARLAHGWEPEPRERVKAAFLSSLSRRREPAAPTPSTIRSSRAFKHPNGAALRIAPLFWPRALGPRQGGAFRLAGVQDRRSPSGPPRTVLEAFEESHGRA